VHPISHTHLITNLRPQVLSQVVSPQNALLDLGFQGPAQAPSFLFLSCFGPQSKNCRGGVTFLFIFLVRNTSQALYVFSYFGSCQSASQSAACQQPGSQAARQPAISQPSPAASHQPAISQPPSSTSQPASQPASQRGDHPACQTASHPASQTPASQPGASHPSQPTRELASCQPAKPLS
jgi:hypothetical protein